jgi:amino acid adenylation domain-containing protein
VTVDRQTQIEEILARRLARSAAGIPARQPGPAPLSFVQQGLWLSWKVSDDPTEGIRPTAYRLRGDLDQPAVSKALDAIVARHETLRSTFPLPDDSPVQVVHPPAHIELPLCDVSGESDPEAAATHLARAHVNRGFDLEREPAFDPMLIRLAPDDHLLAIRIHHIVFDGWSDLVLANELREHLSHEVNARPLALQYADFATWQRTTIDDAALEDSMDFWRERLSPLPDLPEFPATSPSPGVGPAIAEILLDPDRSRMIDDFGRSMGATTFMVLLAAIQALIGRISGESGFLVGVSTAGRDRPGTEDLIGCFINTVLVRANLEERLTFRQLVQRTRSEMLGAMKHAHLPYGRIISEFRPWSDGHGIPLFNVHVQMRDFPVAPSQTRGVSVEPQPPVGSADRVMSFRARHGDAGTEITVSFDAGHLDREIVDRWMGHLSTLIQSFLADPDGEIWRTPLLTASERSELLDRYGNASTAKPTGATLVHERFFEHAMAQPDATAYIDRGTVTTYHELSGQVDRISSAIRTAGADGRAIAMFLPRGPHSVAAMLGILAAGSACAPIDTAVTADWLDFIVRDADCALVLTDREHLSVAAGPGAPVAVVEDLLTAPLQAERAVVPRDSLAVVMYTSGSTGQPKGVMIEQRSLAEFMEYHGEVYGLQPGDRVIQFHSLSFDGSLTNALSPLSHGAAVVLRDDEAMGSIERFLGWVDRNEITHVFVPTSFFHEMASRVKERSLSLGPRVRCCGFGGEKVRGDAVDAWRSVVGEDVVLRNTYGPTETTVWVTSKALMATTPADLVNVPIGRPSPKAAIYILDKHREPVPIGAIGELWVGGPLVSRGYVGRPDETAARFVPDPFADDEEARMYGTGDLATWRSDGDILYLGRADRQVKIRGFRIELEAIEHVLRSHPHVSDAAAILEDGPGGSPRLSAFVETDAPIDTRELHDLSTHRLAAFMRPHSIDVIQRLPRTLSGKLDQLELRKHASANREEETDMTPGIRTIVEEIWAEVLEVERVPTGSTFFELGGHSLLAIRLLSRIKDRLGVDLPLTLLFTHAEIESFSAEVARAHGAEEPSEGEPGIGSDGKTADLDALLTDIESLTDEEAAALLAELEGDAAL